MTGVTLKQQRADNEQLRRGRMVEELAHPSRMGNHGWASSLRVYCLLHSSSN